MFIYIQIFSYEVYQLAFVTFDILTKVPSVFPRPSRVYFFQKYFGRRYIWIHISALVKYSFLSENLSI
jgi:hypothetical protein